jgi:outer membrane usher protein
MPARDRRYATAAWLIAAIMALLSVTAGRAEASADERLLLEVIVNGYPTGKIGEFVLHDGTLFARREELRDLGFRVPETLAAASVGLIALADLPNFAFRLNQATQTLQVTAGTQRLLPALLEAGATPGNALALESGIGTTLDYDVTGISVGHQHVGSGLFDLRAFSPWGVASNGLLAYAGASPSGLGSYSAIRLDSTYVYSDPDTLRRYRLGDFITGGLPWTRPVRLGGGQISSDFSMRPDLITFPLPAVSGSVAVPSTVDVLVNGTRILSREVQPGPFQVPQLPIITGAGTVSMTVTNALGRQVTTELPFYASSALLAPGLQSFSAEGGMVRRNWGLLSNDYGSLAGVATYRRGLSDALTVESHAEAAPGLIMGGAGGVLNVGDLAVVNLAAAASTGSGHTGTQLSAGVQRIGRRFSLAASAIVARPSFSDIAAVNGDRVPELQLNASGGLSLGRFGSLGVAYTSIDRATAPAPIRLFVAPGTILAQETSPSSGAAIFLPAQHSRIGSISYSVQVRDVALYATAFRDFANSGGSGVLIGLTIPLGARSSASTAASSSSGNRSAQVQATQTPVTIGDWGYRVFGSAAHPTHEFAEVEYKSPWAWVSGGADRIERQTTLQGEARGALSFVDGGLFASNRIDDSFAVVDTNGIEGIRVQQENREVGRTDSAGRLLVPDLRSFDINHISIEPTDVPVDTTVPFAAREVRPQDRSGVIVRYPLQTSHGALLRLIGTTGKPVPVGSIATLQSSGASVPVGYDGEAYLLDLQPHNDVRVQWPDGRRCAVSFGYQHKPGEIPVIGPLPCSEQTR